MNRILMLALVELSLFLDLSADDVVDPDAATAQLEQLNMFLEQLAPADRALFASFIRERIAEERNGPPRPDRAERVNSLEAMLQDLEDLGVDA